MTRIAILLYWHRHGVDAIPVRLKPRQKLPEITNELLKKLGVDEPELGTREDESAVWRGPFRVVDLRQLPMGGS